MLPNRLDRRWMPFFKPPANTLDRHQLELCAEAFRQTWLEIARGFRLRPSQEERLQSPRTVPPQSAAVPACCKVWPLIIMRNRDIPCEQYGRDMTRRSLGVAWTLALLIIVGSGNAAKATHKKCHYEKLNCLIGAVSHVILEGFPITFGASATTSVPMAPSNARAAALLDGDAEAPKDTEPRRAARKSRSRHR